MVPNVYVPGDIGVCHGNGFLDRLIQTGERLHGAGSASKWSHAFVVVTPDGGTVEAQARGVVRSTVASHGSAAEILRCPAGVDRNEVVAFAEAQVGVEYGYPDVVLLGLDCLLHTKWHLRADSWICSELAAASLKAGGWKSPKVPASMMPSDIRQALQVAAQSFFQKSR